MAKKVDCSDFAKAVNDLAMIIGSQEDVATLDDVVAEIQKSFPVMPREEIVNAIVDANSYEARKASKLSERLTQIKRDARLEKQTQERIAELEAYLESGTLPEGKPSPEPKGGALGALRAVRDDLKKQLAQSEPAQKARLEKQIAALEEQIADGDFVPQAKPPEVPLSKDLERLVYERNQLRNKIRQAVRDARPRSVFSRVTEPLRAVRVFKTMLDFSAVGRQGVFVALGHPVRAAKAAGQMFQAAFDPVKAARINTEIMERPNAPLYAKAKLYIAPVDGSGVLSEHEEAFMSRWTEKIPGARWSERSYLTFLNVLRADSFDAMAEMLTPGGQPTIEEAVSIARYVNEATGRGSLGSMENAAVGLATVFWAPKYTVSRFQLLMGHPLWGSGTGATRKLIAQEYARFLLGALVVWALGELAGAEFEWDPRSADFAKMRFGRTRVDPWGGLSQVVTLETRIIMATAKAFGVTEEGAFKSSVTGKERDLQAKEIGNFLRTKLSPTFGMPLDVILGKNVVGEEVTPLSALLDAPIPLSLLDVYEAMKEHDVEEATALSVLSIFGMGLQTYGSRR